MADFLTGLNEFETADTIATGLGPIYNNISCISCHSTPSTGGGSTVMVTRYGQLTNGGFNPFTAEDGSLLHALAIDPSVQEIIPSAANVIAHRQTTPLYGAGLIEAIADTRIAAGAVAKENGVNGTISWVTDEATGALRVGRFGWKAQHATLLTFAGDAYTNEIGITNRIFPVQPAPNGNTAALAKFVSLTAGIKDTPDPVTGKADIDRFHDFMQLLAPLARGATATGTAAVAGQKVFTQIGCADCHTPSMKTAPNAVAALSNQNVPLYSDLLLHDMGSLGDGIAQAAASQTQMRTSPLWGLSARRPYLHDGRAATPEEAILAHAGEGSASRASYVELPSATQQDLLAFLGSL